jgi:hypothetical protein
VIDDGAARDIIRDRVTHTNPRKDAFDGYDRGPHWLETCAEVAKLKLSSRPAEAFSVGKVIELATGFATGEQSSSEIIVEAAGVERAP